MNQPDLGHKVIELRQQKGLTQEQLAELCEVSARTIQRIESGEVDPRAYTLQCLSKALEFDFGIDGTANENLWLTILHLSSMFVIVVIPLLLWSWKKNQSSKIDHQGRLVLNFQVTMTLILISAVFLLMIFPIALAIIEESTGASIIEGNPVIMAMLICIPLPLILIGIFCTYQGVVNAMRALSDKPVHYALSIPFVK
jgi:transcriptional regulator with XRE-family HTH domain